MKVITGPEGFNPSHENSEVIGGFNAGATKIKTEDGCKTLLVIRVAEKFKEQDDSSIHVPRWDYRTAGSPLVFDRIPARLIIKQSEKEIEYFDKDGEIKKSLKHTSRLEIRILNEAGKLEKWGNGRVLPKYDFEERGMEDPRITMFGKEVEKELGYKYGVTYVVPHDLHRVSTVIMLTNDFKKFDYLPFGNTPRPVKNGKDMALLPDRYLSTAKNVLTKKYELEFGALVRPSEHEGISTAGIALEYSPNLVAMGLPHRLIENQNGVITGTGAPPVKIGDILLAPYHEAIPYEPGEEGKEWHTHRYVTKMLEMNAKEPWRASINPDFGLQIEDFEDLLLGKGFVPNVVYTTGMIYYEKENRLELFHGINDDHEVVTGHDIIG